MKDIFVRDKCKERNFQKTTQASQVVVRMRKERELDEVTLREHDSIPAGWVIFPTGVRAVFTATEQCLLGLLPLQYGGLLEATGAPLLSSTTHFFQVCFW